MCCQEKKEKKRRKIPFLIPRMSKKTGFPEFQSSEHTENRKKVDVQPAENAADMLFRKERDCSRPESGFDPRKSLAWDAAFSTSPGILDPEELFETLSFRIVDNGVDITGHTVSDSLVSRSMGSEKTSGIGDCSMRKSLAWDSAFFTSAGILDAEELSMLNGGYKKSETHKLPKIQEEIWRTSDTTSTVTKDGYSHGYSLASLEIDLFEDIRASMRKTGETSSNRVTSSCRLRREKGKRNKSTSNISDASPRVQLHDAQTKHGASSGRSNPLSSLKPPKISGRTNSLPTASNKRASSGANRDKVDNKAIRAVSGKSPITLKKTCSRDPYGVVSSSMPSMKLHLPLPTATNEFPGFGSAPPNLTEKHPPNPLRRTAASCLSHRNIKHSTGNKTPMMKSSDSICLLSTPKSSCSTSPASTIDGWSSESSSSINQRSNDSAGNPAKTTCRGISFDNDMTQQNIISNTSAGVSPVVAAASGLRMPSPKFLFFNVDNPTTPTLRRGLKLHSGAPLTSSKPGCNTNNVNGSTSRAKHGKHLLAGPSTAGTNKKGKKDEWEIYFGKKNRCPKGHEHGCECNLHRLDIDNKENISGFENQVAELTRQVEATDL